MEISRRDLELAISTNPGDIAVYILRGTALKTLYASANLPAMSGMSCAEYTAVTRDDAAKIVLADDRPKVTEHIREMLSGGKDANFTCRTANGTGGFIPLRVKCRAIGTMGGSPVILALLAAAPEERGEANVCRRLEEDNYRRLYRQLLDVNPTAIGTMRLNLTQNWCGDGQITPPSLRNVARTGTAEGFFRTICSLIPDDKLREAFREKYTIDKLAGYYRDGRTQFTAEFPLSLPGGEELWVEGCLNTVKNPGNGDLEAIAYMIDVTRRHKNEEIARSLTEENCEMICLIDPKRGTIECMSSNKDGDYPRLNVKLGYADSLRYTADNCVLAEDREGFLRRADIGYVAEALEKGKYSTFSYQCRENGAVRRKQLQFSWLGDRRREILSVRTDITEVYRQEQEQLRRMSQALRTAEAANTAKSEFLSRISHDIRTPMNVISGMTGFALEDMDDREKLREDLRKIQSANQFLLSLINDILDISKIDSGKIELHPEPYPYEDYISNIRSMFEPLCRKKSIAFSVESRLCGGVIMADRIRLNQISLNLLSNAVKYTPEGGAVSCITRSRRTPGGRIGLDIEVRDTGIGMSEDFQKRMFDEFTQENSETGKNLGESGTGLGLAIVRRIVDLMGGEDQREERAGARDGYNRVAGVSGGRAGRTGKNSPRGGQTERRRAACRRRQGAGGRGLPHERGDRRAAAGELRLPDTDRGKRGRRCRRVQRFRTGRVCRHTDGYSDAGDERLRGLALHQGHDAAGRRVRAHHRHDGRRIRGGCGALPGSGHERPRGKAAGPGKAARNSRRPDKELNIKT
jgi:signal transduction histidine kinase